MVCAIEQNLYIAAFNHLTPFPGTPLYHSLKQRGRLRYSAWWLDDDYRYNDVPFIPQLLEPLGKDGQIFRDARLGVLADTIRPNIVPEPKSLLILPRQQAGAGWSADRASNIAVREDHSAPGDRVDTRL